MKKSNYKLVYACIICITFITNGLSQKESELVNEIVSQFRKDPIKFKTDYLRKSIAQLSNNDIEDLIPLLYKDLSGIKEESEADVGGTGSLNKIYNKKNNRIFKRKLKKHGRIGKKLVVIEGDSWFNFPTPLKSDMTKVLRGKEDLLVNSSAFGGDWISRMIKDQSYFDALIRMRPDALILSGGGNDIVGERLASFVDLPANNKLIADSSVAIELKMTTETKTETKNKKTSSRTTRQYTSNRKLNFINTFSYGKTLEEDVLKGTKYLNHRFFKAMVELELQYRLILQQVKNEDSLSGRTKKEMKIIVQGYDYPVPRFNAAPLWCNPWRFILNKGLGSGKWLAYPLKSKGINHPDTQRIVMKAVIFYFNEMLNSLATDPAFYNVFYIDNRGLLEYLGGTIEPARYWFDELHPKEKPYKAIAAVLDSVIKDTLHTNHVINTLQHFKAHDKYKKRTERIRTRNNRCGCYGTQKYFKEN